MIQIRSADTDLLCRPGTRPKLVLLHGIGSGAESWTTLVESLPASHEAFAWWAPGYGNSAPLLADRPGPADYAARLLAVLNGLGLGRVVLVGHSLGCLFAGAFAAAHPKRVSAVGFLSPALGYRVAPGAALPPAAQARIDDLAALGPADFAAQRAARLIHRAGALPGVRRSMEAVKLAGYAQAVHALAQGDLLADARRLAMPVLVACGAQDVVTPPDNARRLHAALPAGSTLRLVPDCGHALPQEAPAEAAAMLAELAHG